MDNDNFLCYTLSTFFIVQIWQMICHYDSAYCYHQLIHSYSRGVNWYVLHTSLMDFHCFDWLTDVRGNPYAFKKIKKIFFGKLTWVFFMRDLHDVSIEMAFV